MHVILINTWDVFGGAARAAHRLYTGLRQAGVHASYLVSDKRSNDRHILELERERCKLDALEGAVQRNYINGNRSRLSNTYFSFTLNGAPVAESLVVKAADVINLHWVEKFISNKSLVQLAELGKPVVWTLHDQRPFTGGCHYTSGCTGFIDGCHDCKQLVFDPHHLPEKVLADRQKILAAMDLTIVTPSNWLAKEAHKSRLLRDKPIRVIANSVDTDLFFPVPKGTAKSMLGISQDVVTLMFGAQHNREKRKGFDELMESLQICLQHPSFQKACEAGRFQIISIGDKGSDISQLPIKSNNFGYIEDDHKLAILYSATDLFIIPSLEDNLPNSLLEAMACGTPVAAFDTGGIPDLLKQGVNGLLAEKGNTAELANAMLMLVFDSDKRARLGRNSRMLIEAAFQQESQASKYLALFEELLAGRTVGAVKVAPVLCEEEAYQPIFEAALGGPFVPDQRSRIRRLHEQLKNSKWYFRNKYSKIKKQLWN